MQPYEHYVEKFNEGVETLLEVAPTVQSMDALKNQGEERQFEFVKAFRALIRLKNILEGFSDFKWSDLSLTEQEFEDYKSKYLDLHDELKGKGVGSEGEKVSILNDVDFELELIHKDEINVAYILKLLTKYAKAKEEDKPKERESIVNIINTNPQLRSKRELIENFIDTMLEHIDIDNIEEEYDRYLEAEKEKAIVELCTQEKLNAQRVREVIETYLYDGRKPLGDDIAKTLQTKPKLLERKKVIPRVLDKILSFVEKFYDR